MKVIPLTIGAWNVRTLMDSSSSDRPERRTAVVGSELDRYKVEIAALSETRLAEEGLLNEVGTGYTFFWNGRKKEQRHEAGVGFAIKSHSSAMDSLGPVSRKHQDWFDENDKEIQGLLEEKHQKHKAYLRNTSSVSSKTAYSNICKTVQTRLRDMQDFWLRKKAHRWNVIRCLMSSQPSQKQ